MNTAALFGASVLCGLVASAIVARLFLWPALVAAPRHAALAALVAPHMFRFVGLAFLVPGVVAPGLQRAFSVPAAYGDLVAAVLAMVAVLALAARARGAFAVAWLFNLWGTADLLFAVYQGEIGVRIDPAALGAAFFIPTLLVPILLVLHVLTFILLSRRVHT